MTLFRGESKLFDKQSKAASGGGQGAGSQYTGQRPGDIPDWQAGFEYDQGIEIRDPGTGNYYRALDDHNSSTSFAADLAFPHWELIAGVAAFLSAVPVNQTVYVDAQFGNDGTAQRERVDLPYLTVTAALTAALAGDTVWVRRGFYAERPLGKDLVDIHLEQGAVIRESGFGVLGGIIDDTAATGTGGTLRMRITGEGQLVRSGSSTEYGIKLENSSSEIYIEGKGFSGNNFADVKDGKLTARFENDIEVDNSSGKVISSFGGNSSIHADRMLGGTAVMATIGGGNVELSARKINFAGNFQSEMIEVTGGRLDVNNSRVEQDGTAVNDHAFRMATGATLVLTDVTIVLGNTANDDVNAVVPVDVHLYGDTRSNGLAKNVNVTERVNTMNRDSNVI